MPMVAQIVCDNCQAVKKATNPWYAVSLENNSFCFKPLDLPADYAMNFPESALQYFCGHFCAIEALTRWMNRLSDQIELSPANADLSPANGKDARGVDQACPPAFESRSYRPS